MSKARSTCVICGKKRYQNVMTRAFNKSWTCTNTCSNHNDIKVATDIIKLYNRLVHINKTHLFR